EQTMARDPIGQRTSRHTHEEERKHPRAHHRADHERRVRQLEREPSEHDDLAHHSDGVEEDRGPEAPEVSDREQRGDDHDGNDEVESHAPVRRTVWRHWTSSDSRPRVAKTHASSWDEDDTSATCSWTRRRASGSWGVPAR